MIKNIFYKIISDDRQRQEMNSLKDQNKIYNLFCKNGYVGSFDDFKTEMKNFLNSDDSSRIINDDSGELSDDLLEMVAGGVNVKRALTVGVATLITAFNISTAVGNSITSGVAALGDDTSISVSTSASESDSFSNLGEEINNDINNYDAKKLEINNNKKSPEGSGNVQKTVVDSEQNVELNGLKQENENLKKQNSENLKQQSLESDRLNQEIDKIKQENENLKKQNKTLLDEQNGNKKEIDSLKKENQNLKTQNKTLVDEQNGNKKEIDSLKKENENLKKQNSENLKQQNNNAQVTDNQQILNKTEKSQKSTVSNDNTVSNTAQENEISESNNDDVALLKNRVERKDKEINYLKDQLESQKNNMNNEFNNKVKDKDAKIAQLESEVTRLNNKIAAGESNVEKGTLDIKAVTQTPEIVSFFSNLLEIDRGLAKEKDSLDDQFKLNLSQLNEKYNNDLKQIQKNYEDGINKIKGNTRAAKEERERKELENKAKQLQSTQKAEADKYKEAEKDRKKLDAMRKEYNEGKKAQMLEQRRQEIGERVEKLMDHLNINESEKNTLSTKLVDFLVDMHNRMDELENKQEQEEAGSDNQFLEKVQKLKEDIEKKVDDLIDKAHISEKDDVDAAKLFLEYLKTFNKNKGTAEEEKIKTITRINVGLDEDREQLNEKVIGIVNNFADSIRSLQNELYKIKCEKTEEETKLCNDIFKYQHLDGDQEANIADAKAKLEKVQQQKDEEMKKIIDKLQNAKNKCQTNIDNLVKNSNGIANDKKENVRKQVGSVLQEIAKHGVDVIRQLRSSINFVHINAQGKVDLVNGLFKVYQEKQNAFKQLVSNAEQEKKTKFDNQFNELGKTSIAKMKQIISNYNFSDEEKELCNKWLLGEDLDAKSDTNTNQSTNDQNANEQENIFGVKLKKTSKTEMQQKKKEEQQQLRIKLAKINDDKLDKDRDYGYIASKELAKINNSANHYIESFQSLQKEINTMKDKISNLSNDVTEDTEKFKTASEISKNIDNLVSQCDQIMEKVSTVASRATHNVGRDEVLNNKEDAYKSFKAEIEEYGNALKKMNKELDNQKAQYEELSKK